jgi:hypothetical protein
VTTGSAAQDAQEASLAWPAAVIEELLRAVDANDETAFARLVQPTARWAETPPANERPTFKELTFADLVATFRGCDREQATSQSIAVYVRARCPGDAEAKVSSFMLSADDGKLRTFYKHSFPMVTLVPR